MINRFQLKILMLIFMLLDHISSFIPGAPIWFHWIGRVVAPVFFYLLVDGFLHTRSKENYIKRMLIAAEIMFIGNTILAFVFPKIVNEGKVLGVGQINIQNTNYYWITLAIIIGIAIYTIITYKIKNLSSGVAVTGAILIILADVYIQKMFPGKFFLYNNIFLSMALSLIMIKGYEQYKEGKPVKGLWFFILALMLSYRTEGMAIAPLMTIIFYLFRDRKRMQYLAYAGLSASFMLGLTNAQLIERPQWMMIFALVFIYLYNDKKGKDYRYIFYVFYPVHIWILYIINYYMIK
ncbi:TraX family protein [Clostridium fallax]|uniref:TraX protein n=1 Tax=Clostridium fallax TaxID=1533 RepID=A0A1M4VJH9_9CLOT|nr:TraX family protein [Clostridium fallax]SHE68997.1 TraX protein [Clostridium fallax]SQB22750.1 membrane protein [Clostridium fallax]